MLCSPKEWPWKSKKFLRLTDPTHGSQKMWKGRRRWCKLRISGNTSWLQSLSFALPLSHFSHFDISGGLWEAFWCSNCLYWTRFASEMQIPGRNAVIWKSTSQTKRKGKVHFAKRKPETFRVHASLLFNHPWDEHQCKASSCWSPRCRWWEKT